MTGLACQFCAEQGVERSADTSVYLDEVQTAPVCDDCADSSFEAIPDDWLLDS